MPYRLCRPLAGDRCHIAEPKPGSSGRSSCNLRLSRAQRQRRLPLDARARLRYLVRAARGTASQQVNNFRQPAAVFETAQEQGLLRAPLPAVTPKRRGEPEFGPKDIRVNCVSPGQVSTDLWLGEQGVAATFAKATGVGADTIRETAASGIATGRFTTPQEVATLVTILASDRTANVTGVNYVIDGGLIKTT